MPQSDLRERLLDTAGALFAQKGYGNVGINEILATAKVARASFYHHFPSKERLCLAWLERLHQRSAEKYHGLLDSRDAPLRKLIDAFDDLKKWMTYNNFRGCPFTNTGAFLAEESPRIRNAIVAHKLLERDFFVGLARELAPAAEVPARALGDTLFLLYTGATTEAQNHRATWPIDRAQSCAQALFQRKDRIDEID